MSSRNPDSSCFVLDSLVRTQMWATPNNLSKYRHLILDTDSIINYLYNACIRDHLEAQRSLGIGQSQGCVLWSGSLINYVKFAQFVGNLLHFLQHHQIQPIVVYGGKQTEAPLFGLISADFKRKMAKITHLIERLKETSKGKSKSSSKSTMINMNWSNLALNIFKQVVNRCRQEKKVDILVFQAYYKSSPLMMKLARDFRCPVLTNNAEFILYDVRAGFIIFDEFWLKHSAELEKSSTDEMGSKQTNGSSRSPLAMPDLHHQFQYHYNFIVHHPGLNPRVALALIPLMTMDFVIHYGSSLKRMRIYDREYKSADFTKNPTKELEKQHDSIKQLKHFHLTANRLEMALNFLRGKDHYLLGALIRSEARRTCTDFDHDFTQLLNFHMVSHEFKTRLRYILKYLWDPIDLNFIEGLLIDRECTASFLLDLFTTSVGHLASVSYNTGLQLEDPKTRHSAWSCKDRAKSMLLSLLSDNQLHQNEKSSKQDRSKEYSSSAHNHELATLTLVDRESGEMVERELNTQLSDKQFNEMRQGLELHELAKNHQESRGPAAGFISKCFDCDDLTASTNTYNSQDCSPSSKLIAIKMNLFRYAIKCCSVEDPYFSKTYSHQTKHIEFALIKASERGRADWSQELKQLEKEFTLESVAIGLGELNGKNNRCDWNLELETSKYLRHCLELLGSSLELYTELNAFFNYPLPNLNLDIDYNPILLFNLSLYSLHKQNFSSEANNRSSRETLGKHHNSDQLRPGSMTSSRKNSRSV